MAGVLIYVDAHNQHFHFITVDNNTYNARKSEILENKSNKILWEKENVRLSQIEDSRIDESDLIERLNKGEEVNLEKELSKYFV